MLSIIGPPRWGIMLTGRIDRVGIGEGLLSRSVKSSYAWDRLTVTLDSEPQQSYIKLWVLIFMCVLTVIRSSAFQFLTDEGEKHGEMTVLQILMN